MLFATFRSEMLRAAPDNFPTECTVMYLASPAEDVIVVPSLIDFYNSKKHL